MKRLLTLFFVLFHLHAHTQKTRLTIERQFNEKNLSWPIKEAFIRVFKLDHELQLWVRYSDTSSFILFKSYNICKLSGTVGPKRREGDLQVPEGFYAINDYNYHSRYYLSLGINYPNRSDVILSSYPHKGGSIYIHGDCVSVGCIAMGNEAIAEIFTIAKCAYDSGHKNVQVHIFPFNFQSELIKEYEIIYSKNNSMKLFLENLKEGFEYFEKTRQLPLININESGRYIFEK